jgi:hypothetical protein
MAFLKTLIGDLGTTAGNHRCTLLTKEGAPNPVFRSCSATAARPGSVRDPPSWTGIANEGIVHAERRYGGPGRLNSTPPIPAHAE